MSPFLSPWEGGGKNDAIVFRSVGGGMKSVMGVPSQNSIVEEVTRHGVMRPSPVSGLRALLPRWLCKFRQPPPIRGDSDWMFFLAPRQLTVYSANPTPQVRKF